ncbi:hypothetical protein SAMN05443551_2599 [Marivita hallyeonensis]|uniref:Uncharacterized protein n=1 Tax=Marivita hallyeonensis TaxID=996342 RepID=A0A1M5UE31_9RHOB|nr:hypothetical protein SAMN05443551_2599 [Marivita hallyeonensis]
MWVIGRALENLSVSAWDNSVHSSKELGTDRTALGFSKSSTYPFHMLKTGVTELGQKG